MDDLISPTVIVVGGYGSANTTPRSIQVAMTTEQAHDPSRRVSVGSSSYSLPTHYSARARSSISSSTSSTRSDSSPSLSGSTLADDNDALRELCEGKPSSRKSTSLLGQVGATGHSVDAKRIKDERKRAKQELRECNAALKAKSRTTRSPPVQDTPPTASEDLSFADMLNRSPPPPPPPTLSHSSPSREELEQQKAQRKTLLKTLKEEEKARKEAEKLAKLKAAVQARNDRIDAHDRQIREKAAQKAAAKQAKLQSWQDSTLREVGRIWGPQGSDSAMLAKTQALKV